MLNTITVLRVDGTREAREVDLPELPDIYDLREMISPLLDGAYPDHFCVLNEGRRTDLFAGELAYHNGHPLNDAATEIFRSAWLAHHPEDDPNSLPAVYGPSVLFAKRVWF